MNHATPLCTQKDKSMRGFVLFIHSSHHFLHLLIPFTAAETGREAGKRPQLILVDHTAENYTLKQGK